MLNTLVETGQSIAWKSTLTNHKY